ncbi:MAG: thermonuclease family protein [Alphaproteobacteria bacterium]
MLFIILAATSAIASGQSFTCTPTRVWDGDGPIWCAEGPKVRLAGIAAREIDETCKPSHPCPKASGRAARDQLVTFLSGPKGEANSGHILVSAPAMRCISNGSARGSRTGAWCSVKGVGELSCAMIRKGVVLRWDRYAGGRCR